MVVAEVVKDRPPAKRKTKEMMEKQYDTDTEGFLHHHNGRLVSYNWHWLYRTVNEESSVHPES